MAGLREFFETYISIFPTITLTGLIEVVIIAFIVYGVILLILSTRAFSLMKGILVILAFTLFSYIFRLNTILWILEKISTIAVIVLVIVFQPELRNALERLGSRGFLDMIGFNGFGSDETEVRETAEKIARAAFSMAAVRTGALITIKQRESLEKFVTTGIALNAVVSYELLMNIFIKNTPLHDGAVIIDGHTILAATCYLPLSENQNISKELGTRHRAALGMSEANDSITIVVSEETGRVSIAYRGKLQQVPDSKGLEKVLINRTVKKSSRKKKTKFTIGRSRSK